MQWGQTSKTRKLLEQGLVFEPDRCPYCGRKMRKRGGELACTQPACIARSVDND
jgi:uncharacterized Zn finger protein (UPF0148 family)